MHETSLVEPARGPTPQQIRLEGVLELKHPPAEPRSRGAARAQEARAWLQALTPILIAILGWILIDAVRIGLQRQQLQLSNVTEMRELLTTLQDSAVTPERAHATAATLSAFGAPAVAPLVTSLARSDDVRTAAIEDALRAIGLNYPEPVCAPLLAILDQHTRRFSRLLHRSAIRIVGDVECPGAFPILQQYAARLAQDEAAGSVTTYDPVNDEWVAMSANELRVLTEELKRALPIVQTHWRPRWNERLPSSQR